MATILGSPIGPSDVYQLVQLSFWLYSEGWRVARNASQDFRRLNEEVDLIRNALFTVHEINAARSLPDNDTIRGALEKCKTVLLEFDLLLRRYRKLASANKDFTWKHLSWVLEQRAIRSCRQDFRDARDALRLALDIDAYRERHQGSNPSQVNGSTPSVKAPERSALSHETEPPQSSAGKDHLESQRLAPPLTENKALRSEGKQQQKSRSKILSAIKFNRKRQNLDREIHEEFEKYRRRERRLNLETWLCIATWWLLKSRKVCYVLAHARNEDRPLDPTEGVWEAQISYEQASADLLKSYWIVEEVILERLEHEELSTSCLEKLSDLAASADAELVRRHNPDSEAPMCTQALRHQNLNLVEPYAQLVEYPDNMPQGLDDLQDSPFRFMVVDVQHACRPDEKVIYRKFVNCQFGPHGSPTRSFSAPYMLLLSCRDGCSDLFISLINQHGTINLRRAAYIADFKMFEEDTRQDGGYLLLFPSQRAVVKFLQPRDKTEFLEHLETLFVRLRDRRAQTDEVQIFREALTFYETRHTSPLDGEPGGALTTEMHTLCEATLFEQTQTEIWRTVRRLVICSNPSSNAMFCTSYWLPLSGVQVQRQDENIALKWSDCSQAHSRPDGEYGQWWSFVYNENHPNRSINLRFTTAEVGRSFADAILWPLNLPFDTRFSKSLGTFAPSSGAQLIQVFEVQDLREAESQGYYAVTAVKQRWELCHIADVYFVHRDLDFGINFPKSMPQVSLNSLRKPRYLSSIVDLPRKPTEDDGTPFCKDVVLIPASTNFSFGRMVDLSAFMKNITSWELMFAINVQYLSYSHGLFFGTTLKGASMQVWAKPRRVDPSPATDVSSSSDQTQQVPTRSMTSTEHLKSPDKYRLAFRHAPTKLKHSVSHASNGNQVTWLTINLDHSTNVSTRRQAYKATLNNIVLGEGDEVDTADFTAVVSEDLAEDDVSDHEGNQQGDKAAAVHDGDEANSRDKGKSVRKLEIKFMGTNDLHDFTKIMDTIRDWPQSELNGSSNGQAVPPRSPPQL